MQKAESRKTEPNHFRQSDSVGDSFNKCCGVSIWNAPIKNYLACSPLNLLGMFGWRTFIRWRRAHAHARGRGVRRALIIGAGALGREVAAALESDDGRKLVGFLDNEQLGGTVL